jgi:alpha,alpha-trehalase
MSTLPVGDYALLSDCRTAALVSRTGSVDWLCFPRFDGPAVFARLLDDAAGHFAVRVPGAATQPPLPGPDDGAGDDLPVGRRHRGTGGRAGGRPQRPRARAGRRLPKGAAAPGGVHRGRGRGGGQLRPRPEHGLVHPLLEPVDGGIAARGGADRLLLSAPAGFVVDGATAGARLRLRAGESAGFALHHARSWEPPPRVWSQEEVAARLEDTVAGWRSWSAMHQGYEGPLAGAGAPLRPGAAGAHLRAHRAIVAAATTSLPEVVGGERNRDYRYTWVRDASLTMEALWVAACPDEAHKFFGFLAGAAASQLRSGADLQIMFGVGGERDLTERDQGIWEVRGEPRDFLYSKLMCWVALDRAIALAELIDAKDRVEGWTASREEVRAAILDHGWSETAGAFTQAFGSDELDASNLMLAITGFLPGDDPRMKATIDATAARLTDERGPVYRYRAPDGLEGEEATFLLCTFWLAQAQALAGEVEQATATFERAVAYANDVGLLAEEVDAGGAEMIGNYPQAFSHIGLVNAAWAIDQAARRQPAAAG